MVWLRWCVMRRERGRNEEREGGMKREREEWSG